MNRCAVHQRARRGEEHPVLRGQTKYQANDANKGHDNTFFIQLNRVVFAD